MAIQIQTPMTPEQLINNYQFKVVKRILLMEFPWMKDVSFYDDELNQYNLIFLNFIIDPIELGEEHGWEFNRWTKHVIENNMKYRARYLALIYDISLEEGKVLSDKIERLLDEINNSSYIPTDLRLPAGRRFSLGHYIINPDSSEEYV